MQTCQRLSTRLSRTAYSRTSSSVLPANADESPEIETSDPGFEDFFGQAPFPEPVVNESPEEESAENDEDDEELSYLYYERYGSDDDEEEELDEEEADDEDADEDLLPTAFETPSFEELYGHLTHTGTLVPLQFAKTLVRDALPACADFDCCAIAPECAVKSVSEMHGICYSY